MRHLALSGIVAACALAACARPAPAPQPVADMLAPARAGAVQCFSPNLTNKTCRSIVGYRFGAGGAIFSDAQVIMQVSPTVVMRATTQMVQRQTRLCGEATPADIDAAQFTVGGTPATDAQAQDLRTKTKTHLAARGHSELCAEFVPETGGFEVRAFADGARQPGFDDHVVWIRPDAGFTINETP